MTVLPKELIDYDNQGDFHVRLKNKSEVWGTHLQSETKIKSFNVHWGWIDEACEIGEDCFRQFQARARAEGGARKIWLTGNPEGRNWVYEKFINKPIKGSEYFHGKTRDVSFLPQDYIDSLYETYDTEMVERLLEGSWETFQGQVFPMFSRELHILPADFPIPKNWQRYRGVDHGYVDPCTCVWLASDEGGNFYVYNLYYKRKRIIEENVAAIQDISGDERYVYTVADPNVNKADSGTGRKHIDLYREAGLELINAKTSLAAGIARMRELFEPKLNRKHPLKRSLKKAPALYVLSHCKELINELLSYHYEKDDAKRNSNESPVDKDNHAIDALRYIIMHNPQPSEEDVPQTIWEYIQRERDKEEDGTDFSRIIGNERAIA